MNTPKYSVIIPLYNRPDEIKELLDSLLTSNYNNFETIIIEDGSTLSSEGIIEEYYTKLNIQYFKKHNEGPGLTRNYGANKALGQWVVFFDSDCLIPSNYFEEVENYLSLNPNIDCFGGPDKAHPSFTDVQKAISYSMTALLTTGGIRGGDKEDKKFHPRSFNMGFKRLTFLELGGYSNMRFGEDLDFSFRIISVGLKTALIPKAYVYHKRRTDFNKFFKQIHNSGIARINLYKRHPFSLKLVNFLPSSFIVFSFLSLFCLIFKFYIPIFILMVYSLAILVDSSVHYKSIKIGLLSLVSTYVQHFAYGTGFIKAFWRRIILKKDEFHACQKNFYK